MLALAVVICAGMALPAVSAAATATLEGVVESESGQKLEGAEVCALEEVEEEPQSVRCASTSASGAYTLTINTGAYYIEFYTSRQSGLNYVTQYYDGVDSLADATKMTLSAGEKRTIDAKLQPAGAISGVVQATGRGVDFAIACALESAGKHAVIGCIETGSNGEFTISKLPSGQYDIGVLTFGGGYISPQYFSESNPEAFTLQEAEGVTVTAGLTATLTPMELHEGAKISGTVSNASIEKQPISDVEVCALPTGGLESSACGTTNAAGEYTIEGLASGSYKVEFYGEICSIVSGSFSCTKSYRNQFYSGKSTEAEASLVTVTAPLSISGVDASLSEAAPKQPAVVSAPTLSGNPAVGATLSCSQGSWSNNPTSLTYAWLSNGAVIAGQAGATYTVQATDQGHSITCEVTTSNSAGSAVASSNALAIPAAVAPPAPAPKAGTAVAAGKATVKSGVVQLTLTCTGGGACKGQVKLTVTVKGPKRHGKRKTTTVTVGEASFSITSGGHQTLSIPLTSKAKNLLAKAGKHGLKVQLGGSGLKARQVVLVQAAAGKHKVKHGHH